MKNNAAIGIIVETGYLSGLWSLRPPCPPLRRGAGLFGVVCLRRRSFGLFVCCALALEGRNRPFACFAQNPAPRRSPGM